MGGIGIFGGLNLAWFNPEIWEGALLFFALGGWLLWRAVRGWRRPYVQLTGSRLVVFERGRPKHYVELSAIASVRHGFNRTVLLLRDGMKLPISHLGFMRSEDAQDFREKLAERLGVGKQ